MPIGEAGRCPGKIPSRCSATCWHVFPPTVSEESLETAKRILEEAGAPVGSHFLFERSGVDVELPFGVQEALTLYLDGVSLPDEVYQELDLDDFMARLAQAVESAGGEPRTTWTGPTETAFHHYGPTDGATRTIRLPRRAA